MIEWLEHQFSEIRDITGEPPAEEEKRRVLRETMEERDEDSEFPY